MTEKKELEKYKAWKEDKNGEREIEKEQEKETNRGRELERDKRENETDKPN